MLEILNKDNFEDFSGDKNENYEDFKNYITESGLHINCFYVDKDNWFMNRIWYIEEYITIPMPIASKDCIDMFRLKDVVPARRRLIEELKNERDYVGIFTLIEKCYRMSYFLELYEELEDDEFLELFEFVYSSCEYNFDWLLKEDILQRIKEAQNLEKIKEKLVRKYDVQGDVITIYRGEADESTHFKNGAVSWTLDYSVASFFANRFSAQNPRMYKANVLVKDILMLIDREKEVVVTEDKLLNIENIKLN